MNTTMRNVVIILAVGAAVAAAIVLRGGRSEGSESSEAAQRHDSAPSLHAADPAVESAHSGATSEPAAALPKLVDLGADKCIPCMMMKPILEELKRDYAEKFTVEFIDVWEDPQPGRDLGIKVIPTQIFFDADGEELFRHEGFFSKEDILSIWERHGIDVDDQAE